jgi:hypothetical protein
MGRKRYMDEFKIGWSCGLPTRAESATVLAIGI